MIQIYLSNWNTNKGSMSSSFDERSSILKERDHDSHCPILNYQWAIIFVEPREEDLSI